MHVQRRLCDRWLPCAGVELTGDGGGGEGGGGEGGGGEGLGGDGADVARPQAAMLLLLLARHWHAPLDQTSHVLNIAGETKHRGAKKQKERSPDTTRSLLLSYKGGDFFALPYNVRLHFQQRSQMFWNIVPL